MKTIEIEMPIIVVSEANRRDHHMARYRRSKRQSSLCKIACLRLIKPLPEDYFAKITLTRLGKRTLDTDNLAGAFKSVRDIIADLLGVDDGSDRLTWIYAQEKAKKRIIQDTTKNILNRLFEDGTGIRLKIEFYPSLESQAENAMEIFADMRQRGEG